MTLEKILVVDDEQNIVKLTLRILNGLKVDTASNYDEALRALNGEDSYLGLSNYQLLTKIKE